MSEWQPATDAEVAMRDALRTDDQEQYFRILAGVDLLLPVSAEALAGNAPLGWGTWSTGGRTHVLAFTSTAALQSCLADYTGSARQVPYGELANTWPNLEWWLAVNPGLPIEGYLPAWFVAQLSRGDLRLPTRGPGREKSQANRINELHSALAAKSAGSPQGEAGHPQQAAYGQPAGSPQGIAAAPGGNQQPPGGYGAPYPPDYSQPGNPAMPGYPQPSSSPPAVYPPGGAVQSGPRPSSAPPAVYPPGGDPHGYSRPGSASPAGYPPGSASPAGYPPGGVGPSGYPQPSSAPPGSYPQPGAAGQTGYPSHPSSAPPAGPGYPQPGGGAPSGFPQPGSAPPSGFPQPGSAPPAPYPLTDIGALSGYPSPGGAPPASSPPSPLSDVPAGYAQAAAAAGRPPGFPPAGDERAAGRAPGFPPVADDSAGPAKPELLGPGGLPLRNPGAVLPSGLPSRVPPPSDPVPQPFANDVPPAYRPPDLPLESTTGGWPVVRPGEHPRGPMPDPHGPMPDPHGPGQDQFGRVQDPHGPLPVRTPMANTPPVPEHLLPQDAEAPVDPRWAGAGSSPSDDGHGFPQGPASPQAAAAQRTEAPGRPTGDRPPAGEPAPGFGGPLPRRQATAAGEPAPMTSFPAFRSPAERAAMAAEAGRAGTIPPVVPGGPGNDRPPRPTSAPPPDARGVSGPPLEVRGAAPVPPLAPRVAFDAANDVERDLFEAADSGSTDRFLSTLLLATVLVPVAHHSRPGSTPGESGFAFRTEQIDDEQFLVVFTSKDRLGEHFAEPTRTVSVRFYELIRNWPDPAWSFAVNPGSPVGAKYPGPQVIALANWATEAGLGAEPSEHPGVDPHAPVPAPEPASDDAQHATVMQKTLPPEQVDYYLERGYDRVAGFVHRATEVEHLRTPAELFGALGLTYDGSPHLPDAKEAFVLRWPAYRPSLYRIPYGGQNEQALRAMDGWVIERPPFRGNGFAPGEGRDVIAEFKVDSVRLPHGAQLWRVEADGTEHMVAIFDNDGPQWRRVGEQ